MERRAKILATIGPASADPRILSRVLRAGADVLRLNLSHGTREEHRALLQRIRDLCRQEGLVVGMVVDLMGPRYRIGELEQPIELKRNQEITLGYDLASADLPVSDAAVVRHLQAGERVLIDNGLVELEVTRKRGERVRARVISGGQVLRRKGINLPDSDLPFSISRKDRQDITLAVEEEADFIAASYVGRAADVQAVRQVIRRAGGEIPIVAKLERARAVLHLEEIVEAADAVMVARGDLGVEVPLHEVPVIQKRIIDASWRLGKPVIVATQMLESMMEHPRPTRAEATDVANAVLDGADALMLSGETAAGRYPVEAVRTMARIIVEAEEHRRSSADRTLSAPGQYDLEPPARPGSLEIPETVSAAAVLAARQVGARQIVALTQGGFTATLLAWRRPSTPVLALTASRAAARRLQLVWGVRPLLFDEEVVHHSELVELVDRRLVEEKLARPGDRIVILMGDPIQARPPTNLMRLHTVRRVTPGR